MIPDSDPRWRRSDAEPAMFCLLKIVSHVWSKLCSWMIILGSLKVPKSKRLQSDIYRWQLFSSLFTTTCLKLDGYGNGRSEQSGQLRQLGPAPDMYWKVRTTWISDYIGACPEKKVWNSLSQKYRTGLHLVNMVISTEQYLAAIGRWNARKMCSTSELPDTTVLGHPGAKFDGDGLVLKGPWKQHAAQLSVIMIFGLMYRADSRFAPSQTETALHWMGASLESGLDVAQPHNFPRQWTYTT